MNHCVIMCSESKEHSVLLFTICVWMSFKDKTSFTYTWISSGDRIAHIAIQRQMNFMRFLDSTDSQSWSVKLRSSKMPPNKMFWCLDLLRLSNRCCLSVCPSVGRRPSCQLTSRRWMICWRHSDRWETAPKTTVDVVKTSNASRTDGWSPAAAWWVRTF